MEPNSGTPTGSASSSGALFSPASVLDLAFCGHDFTTQHHGREVQIQTSQPSYDGKVTYLDVTAIDWTDEDPDATVTYRYRVERIPE